MTRKPSEAEQKGFKNLMKGTGYDKGLVEKQLIKLNPEDLEPGILNIWLRGKRQSDIERANRVMEAWQANGYTIPEAD